MTSTIMLCTDSHFPILLKTLPRMLENGIDPLIYCCGSDLADNVSEIARVKEIPYAEGGSYRTAAFQFFITKKLDIILEALENDDVLFLDTDILVFKPLTIDTDCDIYAQNEYPEIREWGDVVCTGCWWIRSCQENKDMLLAAKKRMNRKEFICDEMAVNLELRKVYKSIRTKYAPLQSWQTGERIDSTSLPELIHFNGRGKYGVDAKIAAMREYES